MQDIANYSIKIRYNLSLTESLQHFLPEPEYDNYSIAHNGNGGDDSVDDEDQQHHHRGGEGEAGPEAGDNLKQS